VGVCAALNSYNLHKFNDDNYANKFSYRSNNTEYVFTTNDDIIGDKQIKLLHRPEIFGNDWKTTQISSVEYYGGTPKTLKDYDKVIVTLTIDAPQNSQHIKDNMLEFLNDGNILISTSLLNIDHPNYIFSPLLNLFLFYYYYGYVYLNYYSSAKKQNLLGLYHDKKSGNLKHWRNKWTDYCEHTLGKDFLVYDVKSDDSFKTTLQQYNALGFWGQNHITSYTDYNTSVCNIVFETFGPSDNPSENISWSGEYITEKTLKAILFGQADIFFIWYGSEYFFEYLKDCGFWFLNTEFYQKNVHQSAKDTILYLKTLKEALKTNEAVQSHLLEKHDEKLKNNMKVFNNIINNYPERQRILQLIND
jgi:hypothetical protein